MARGAQIMAIQVFASFTQSSDCGGAPPCARTWTSDFIAGLGGSPGSSNAATLARIFVGCGTNPSGSCPFPIPGVTAPGSHQLRLFANSGALLATSANFSVTASVAASLSVSPSSVVAGGSVTASWSGIGSPTSGDWIGLYTPGSANASFAGVLVCGQRPRRAPPPDGEDKETHMARAYNIIDADGHILEPLDLWTTYMDPAFRDRAPRLIKDTDGKERLLIESQVLGSSKGLGAVGGVGARQGVVADDTMSYLQGKKGGFDPHARIPDMDLDGIDAAFLYPSLGLFAGAIQEPPLAAAVCRAYNRWLADYCRPYPDRLFGVAMLPMQSVELAIEEMKFARRELGMRGGFLRPNPYGGRALHHPDNEPFWREAEELDFAIGFHEGSSAGMPQVGVDRFETRGAKHIISHTMEMMLAAMSMIWGGVCERYPKLRVGFLESGGGWMAPWLDRMDRHFDDAGFNDSGLKTRPSEIFQRNCWISFEPVEGSLSVLADYIGPHKILWATDYPHPDGFFPGAPDMIARRPELSEATKREILGGGARRFYKL